MITALRGTRDILPPESSIWQRIESAARHVFHIYGFQELRTPIMEEAQLFQRGVGETSELVDKQMYTFVDRGDRTVCLRPEATASAARAFLEAKLHKQGAVTRWYYMGPMFRSERPQAGRQRQFHQLGVELFGSFSPYADAEVMILLMRLLEALGAGECRLLINTLGSLDERTHVSRRLYDQLAPFAGELDVEARERMERNVFRILDSKDPKCRDISRRTGGVTELVGAESREHFACVQDALRRAGVPFEVDPYLVRGLDYYSRTVFEVQHPGLGAQDAIAAGGRYDGLLPQLGGDPCGAVGFAVGVERVLIANRWVPPEQPGVQVFVAPLSVEAYAAAHELSEQLRRTGLSTVAEYDGYSLKALMRHADKLGCYYVVMLGQKELSDQRATVRDMRSGEQRVVAFEQLAATLSECVHRNEETNA